MEKWGTVSQWLREADNLVWGPGMLALLLGTGIYLMVSLDFLPLKNLKFALLCAIGAESKRKTKEKHPEGISSFSSLTTELAATIGTGNIVGVATAMVLGGPGSLIWMMLSSLIGMATKLVESMLAVKYRSRNTKNEFVGGPMYTMANGLPNRKIGRFLGGIFAFFAVMASFGMGNMTQSNSIADAMKVTFHVPVYGTGLVVTVITILVVLGGIGSISKVTKVMVPFMGIFYLLGTFWVILTHLPNLPYGIFQMIGMAFSPRAVCGGIGGQICANGAQALRWGVSRGVFSNEAGLGAAGISAAAADTKDYVKQGYISMTGVFLDTMVICFVTGLAIAASGMLGTVDNEGGLLTGTALIIAVFQTTFGEYGAVFVSICIALFAFATIVGWAYQGEKAFEFLAGTRYCMYYRFFYALVTFVGAVCSLQAVWDFSDICNALMAVPNLICVLLLSKEACEEIKGYKRNGDYNEHKKYCEF
ncbi:MAG: amino acid carrier protein [Bacteroidales bacterium]|nr:amino acid carrier protein [Lachnoclostridium sp.]MCM1382923.1 amino acid carrier protein [Lachnoclostridium sp.]MCM1465929.1 amino acid carrier protein [Bacteroidales bacterium]